MSREIKFRAWDIEHKKMILPRINSYYQHFVSFCGNVFLRTYESMMCFGGGDNLSWEMRKKVLMQYTGLKDKNGIEIYEADILDINSPIMGYGKSYVRYKNGSFRLGCGPDLLGGYLAHEIEVIGNIYENPELMEDK